MLHIKWLAGTEAEWQQLEARVEQMFPGAKQTKTMPGAKQWTIHQDEMPPLGEAFTALQKCMLKFRHYLSLLTFQLHSNTGKRELNFENYEFSQTTLEHVFFKIAKDQEQETQDQDD